MVNASNAVVADKGGAKTGTEKAGEKVLEKRRALGRGLDSLLAGPRVVTSAPVAADQPPAAQSPPPSSSPSSSSSHSHLASTSSSASSFAADAGAADVLSDGSSITPSIASSGAAGPAVVGEIRASGQTADGELVYQISPDLIDGNPYQTRSVFDEEALNELADSIRVQGLLQPIVVRPGKESGRFTLILGERRLRASRIAEKETIPAIVKRVSPQQAAEMTVVENLQRRDLNCVEQANAFSKLSTEFLLTQEQIGERVGLSRGAVSNYMRLLELPSGVQEALWGGRLTFSHARLLSRLKDHVQIWSLAKRIMEEKMSVEQLEAVLIGVPKPGKDPNKVGTARWQDPNVKAAQRSLEEILGMRVRIRDRQGRGKIVIDYNTIEDFERVVGMLRGK